MYRIPYYISGVAAILIVFALAFDWMGLEGVAALEYCEALRDRWIRQPANSWSNLGFVLSGWMMVFESSRRFSIADKGPFEATPFYPVFLSILIVLIGIGSFTYHASTTQLGGYLDAGSMYLLSTFMLVYALKRMTGIRPMVFTGLYIVGLAMSFGVADMDFMLPGEMDAHAFIFGVYLLGAFGLETYLVFVKGMRIEKKWMAGFVLTFLVSTFIWAMSRTGAPWCDPSSLLQGHAIWHILDALCVYFIYRYYRSEN